MKAKTTTAKPLDLVGNGSKRDREIFASVMEQWRHRIAYCSVFTAISAVLSGSLAAEARTERSKTPTASVGEEPARPQKPNLPFINRYLLKRQSEFRLPHQNANFLPTFVGNDDCPGKSIPAGTYTSVAPYTDSGDTTGANDTINRLYYSYYNITYPAHGPDHVYSFTITNRGANPEIRVSTASSTYKPLVYIIDAQYGRCPANTGNQADSWWIYSQSQNPGGTVTLGSQVLRYLPLGVPLYLFIDGAENDANGSGAYTVQMQDLSVAQPCSAANLIDCPEFFVHQHYYDFLNRQPEENGFNAWLSVMNNCASGDLVCQHEQRLTTSAGFFGSQEFQLKGYYAFRFYRVAFGRLPQYSEIFDDMWYLYGETPDQVYTQKASFADYFMQRLEFAGIYNSLSNTEYVAALLDKYGLNAITTANPAQPNGAVKVNLTRSELVSRLDIGTLSRAQVLRAVADSDQIFQSEFNRAFVAMQYYGYLRRTPEPEGYNDWLDYLNTHPGDFREMVRGFVDSVEYRNRFGTP
jgi:uncharacterized protein DUF4214